MSFLDPSSRQGQHQTHTAFNAKVAEQPGAFYAVLVQGCWGELRASPSGARCRFSLCRGSSAAREAVARQVCRRVLRVAPSLLRALPAALLSPHSHWAAPCTPQHLSRAVPARQWKQSPQPQAAAPGPCPGRLRSSSPQLWLPGHTAPCPPHFPSLGHSFRETIVQVL